MGALDNKTILFSGVFDGYERTDLEKQAESAGAKLLSGVSKNLNYLVAGEKMGPQKRDKANELGVPIITLDDFFKMLPDGGSSVEADPIKKLKLPKVLPQTGAEAVKFIESLKLKKFKMGKVKGSLAKDEYTKEFNDTLSLISSMDTQYRDFALEMGLDDYFSEVHEEMYDELDEAEKKKMQKTSFKYKSKEEAYFPLEDYVDHTLYLGKDYNGDAFICLTDMRSINGSIPVAQVFHDACESYCEIWANSLAEFWCRWALKAWGEENDQDDEIDDYLDGLKKGFVKS